MAAKKATKDVPAPDYGDLAGYDVLMVNGSIDDSLFAKIVASVAKNKGSDKLVLAIVTYGGLANAGFRIGRLLQSMYEDIVVFVPSFCKSAGTLVAMSGNKLVLSAFGEIGPLDVQLAERDEIGERKSGLTMRSALEDLSERSFELFSEFMMNIKHSSGNNISFKLAAELAKDVTTGLMSNIYSQIHPDVLGKDYRDLSVATKYGQRLNKKFGNISDAGIRCLVHDYPSHDFVIDYDEAAEIFQRVELPANALMELSQRNNLMVPKINGSVVKMEHWPVPESEENDETGVSKNVSS